jgi:putative ABC transport system substrate-binding protein
MIAQEAARGLMVEVGKAGDLPMGVTDHGAGDVVCLHGMNDPQPEGHMASHIERRKFLATLGGAALARPLAARAQQFGKLPTIGFLGAEATAWSAYITAFAERLRALGWIEGRTIAIEYRWSEGRPERVAEIAAEFVRLKVDVIVTNGDSVDTARRAIAAIPIVFALANDPVGGRLVTSLAQPGGNVTGLSLQATDLGGKRLELLREIVPGLRRLAIMVDVGYSDSVLEMGEVQAAARTLSIEVAPAEIRRAEDIGPAIEAVKAKADALYVVVGALIGAYRTRIITSALGARLPTLFSNREQVQAGGLMSYGPSVPDMFHRAADLVDKILRGAKPGDIPVEQPTRFELVINLTTARALGLTIPDSFLLRADEVIE